MAALELNPLLRSIWADPVWSKVISTLLLAALAAIGTYLLRPKATEWLNRRRAKRGLQGTLSASIDDLPHAPIVRIDLHNRSHKPIHVHGVEFVTKAHWDIPDPYRTGVVAPVANYLPAGARFIKVSEKEGAVASKAVAMTLAKDESLTLIFRVITDHAPDYAIGLFPYLLGVTVTYGDKKRLALSDLLVSVHGGLALSMSEYSRPMLFDVKPGDVQNLTNAALSRITENVVVPPEVLAHLKRSAGLA